MHGLLLLTVNKLDCVYNHLVLLVKECKQRMLTQLPTQQTLVAEWLGHLTVHPMDLSFNPTGDQSSLYYLP